MEIQENVLLAPFTTFKIGGSARWFCVVRDQFNALEAYEFAKKNNLPTFVLGGGSNVLISDRGFKGLVIKVENFGIEVITPVVPSRPNEPACRQAGASDEFVLGKALSAAEGDTSTHPQDCISDSLGMVDKDMVLLKVASGEIWDTVVDFAVKNKWWGIENLSHIPGSTGAIAVQNVGAYGQEASNLIKSVTVFKKDTRQILELSGSECEFSYRKSIFNSTQKGKYIIFNVSLILSKTAKPILTYRDLQNHFSGKSAEIQDIRRAVIEIRNKKYPFPKEAKLGNAGSFFKNSVLTEEAFQRLLKIIGNNFGVKNAEELNSQKFIDNGQIKIPTAHLLEICGLKDLREGGAKINHNQPLVIVNETGAASAADVLGLANQVRQAVLEKTGISLEFEPELIGF